DPAAPGAHVAVLALVRDAGLGAADPARDLVRAVAVLVCALVLEILGAVYPVTRATLTHRHRFSYVLILFSLSRHFGHVTSSLPSSMPWRKLQPTRLRPGLASHRPTSRSILSCST